MKNKNGEEIQIKADAGVSFNGIIDLSSVSGFKDFVLPGQNEYSVYIWMNDTRNTQEGFVTLSGLEFITSSPSEEYTTYSSAEGWIGDSQAEINCRYPGLEIYTYYSNSAETEFGDVNGDGVIDIRDFIRMKKIIASGVYDVAADVNVDKANDAEALTLMKQYLLGTVNQF